MSKVLFVTGATGSVGLELLRALRKRPDVSGAYFMVRAGSPQQRDQCWAALLQNATSGQLRPADLPSFQPVAGDITQAGFGFSIDDLARLGDEVTHVIHSAAAIDFNADLQHVTPINVGGTKNLLMLVASFRRLCGVAHVSTLYVAGRRTGSIRENELEHTEGFINAYEQSKAEAERIVRARMGDLPLAIHRLPLLVGRAEDGYVHTFLEAHKFLELNISKPIAVVPGRSDNPLEFMPTDVAAGAIVRLLLDHFRPGQTHQIACGTQVPRLGDMMDLVWRHAHVRWPRPRWIDRETLDRLQSNDDVDLPASAVWMLDVVGDYLLLPKIFENTSVAAFPWYQVPPIGEYLPRVLDYCLRTNWGRS